VEGVEFILESNLEFKFLHTANLRAMDERLFAKISCHFNGWENGGVEVGNQKLFSDGFL